VAAVLSIAKMGSGSERYYLETVASGREDYYTGAGEAQGDWRGAACFDLGLTGEVSPEDLAAVLAALSPLDGSGLTASRVPPERRVAGFDLTFSCPKSVSVLYGLGTDPVSEAVRKAHDDAVCDGLAYIEAHSAVARRGHDGVNRMETSGLVAAGFRHRTSRAGDPQLHTHVLVANLVHGSDDRWSSLHAAFVYRQGRTAGFVYQAALRAGLTAGLGLSFGPVTHGAAEITGMPTELLKEFSTRRAEIEARLEELGGTSRRIRELATLETRHAKEIPSDADRESLRETWRRRCLDAGFTPDVTRLVLGLPHEPVVTEARQQSITSELLGSEGLTEYLSTFERRDAVRGVAERLPEGGRLAVIESLTDSVLAHDEVVLLDREGGAGEQLRTTKELLRIESYLIGYGDRMRSQGGVVPDEIVEAVLAERPGIAEEQAEMVRRLTTSGDGLQVVLGKAGAGKTYALDAARAAWQRAGFSVQGTALSARAAAELESGAGISSCTLARFMQPSNLDFSQRDVIVLDEAGLVGTRALQSLVFFAKARRASVVLVGDHRQLPAIEAGGALRALADALGPIQLTENRRQTEGWERRALRRAPRRQGGCRCRRLRGAWPAAHVRFGAGRTPLDGERLGELKGRARQLSHVRHLADRRRGAEPARTRGAAPGGRPRVRCALRRLAGLRRRRRGDVPPQRPAAWGAERDARDCRRCERRRARRRHRRRHATRRARLPARGTPRSRLRLHDSQVAGRHGRPGVRARG
jgi:conjugative relaxase-like TrwC/TraI family protein